MGSVGRTPPGTALTPAQLALLREGMARRGMRDYSELAAALGVSRWTVYKWLGGARGLSPAMQRRLADALDVPLARWVDPAGYAAAPAAAPAAPYVLPAPQEERLYRLERRVDALEAAQRRRNRQPAHPPPRLLRVDAARQRFFRHAAAGG